MFNSTQIWKRKKETSCRFCQIHNAETTRRKIKILKDVSWFVLKSGRRLFVDSLFKVEKCLIPFILNLLKHPLSFFVTQLPSSFNDVMGNWEWNRKNVYNFEGLTIQKLLINKRLAKFQCL